VLFHTRRFILQNDAADGQTLNLDICSTIEMLEPVGLVTDRLCRMVGFDGETLDWVGLAVRESVINAIKHGNKGDTAKRVFIEFTSRPHNNPPELAVRVRDQGRGFDVTAVPNPLAPENRLKATGRGIFLMRSFMDEVSIERRDDGSTEVRMVKRLPKHPA
jgi:serine/threonine-protein kinase RsbW